MTEHDWNTLLLHCGVKPITAGKWAVVFNRVVGPSTFSAGINEIDDWCGQLLHESGMLERLEENLNYSTTALLAKFGRHRITEADARKYGRTDTQRANQPAIANCLYCGAWGAKNLGNTETGDGWKYRGRGLMQITGRANYRAVGKVLGLDLEASPDLLAHPETALRASIAWWEGNVPDSVMGDIVRVTKRVNGGTLGLDHRAELTDKAAKGLA